jgi:acetoacetyl-CoA reductase
VFSTATPFQGMDGMLRAAAKWAELTGFTIDEVTRRQLRALNIYLDTSAKQHRWLWKGLGLDRDSSPAVASRVVLVTGGIGGIGTAICQRLSQDGYTVVASHLSGEMEQAHNWQQARFAEGQHIEIVDCDVADFDSCAEMAANIEAELGPVDILINCAGIARDAQLRKMHESEWHAVLDTNLDGIFNVTRQVAAGMAERGFGRIVNISSVNGQKGQFGQTNYSAAKAGILGFTRALARELADHGVTVNAICPGYVATNMMNAVPEHILNAIIERVPIGRLAKPEEIAAAVAFLCAEDSAYITGTELAVNGGLYMG